MNIGVPRYLVVGLAGLFSAYLPVLAVYTIAQPRHQAPIFVAMALFALATVVVTAADTVGVPTPGVEVAVCVTVGVPSPGVGEARAVEVVAAVFVALAEAVAWALEGSDVAVGSPESPSPPPQAMLVPSARAAIPAKNLFARVRPILPLPCPRSSVPAAA